MQIFVKVTTGQTLTLMVEPTDTVASVKQQIFVKEGTPPANQQLVFAGKTLADENTLQDYSIQKDSTLHMIFQETRISVIVRAEDGQSYTVKVEPSDTVATLKGLVQDATGVDVARQTLELNGVELVDGDTVAQAGITDGAELTLRVLTIDTPVEEPVFAPETGMVANDMTVAMPVGYGAVEAVMVLLVVLVAVKSLRAHLRRRSS
jgi:hypothetical protein